jgi:NAD+ synthase (glutamine-hydrolysing)
MRRFRVSLAQINPTVGDIEGNTRRIVDGLAQARALGADLVAFPELAVTGYPPEDLLFKSAFIEANLSALADVTKAARGLTAVVGFVDRRQDLFNAAAVIHDGALAGVYHKQFLPNYGVFDENRYFQAGREATVFAIGSTCVAVNVCEDIWYPTGPTTPQALAGAELIVTINGSPYHAGKAHFRERMIATRAADDAVWLAFVNMVGGQDELVFDGASMIVDPHGQTVARGRQFVEELVTADVDLDAVFRARMQDSRRRKETLDAVRAPLISVPSLRERGERPAISAPLAPPLPRVDEVFQALVVGTRDYVRKNGFQHVVLGLSGGIDSTLVAVVAVDALGADRCTFVTMPSRYSSEGTRSDAKVLADNLGVRCIEIPIAPAMEAYDEMLAEAFEGREPDITEENLQARIRGNLLMALSNKFGWLVLTTGNKSETAVGYSTLYGDSAGGFAPIKDVPKTFVFALARYLNEEAGKELIPVSIIERPPSAELRDDQRDDQSLPPYEELDPLLEAYVEDDLSPEEIAARGLATLEVARRIARLVDLAEYKRRQAPPGIKVHEKAFGRDRRVPITNRFGR